ncbi:MAG: helicase-related protein, partial [Thermodesulfovibrionales bacterium]|nr:helicase-related protein [Thermodesulfovibrionales bacterium]
LDRQRDYPEYIRVVKENAREIRDKVLKYLMVRRTRTEIAKYFADDLKHQNLKFPEVENPEPLFYELNDIEDEIFNKTIELIAQKFKYARYMPLLYYNGPIPIDQLEKQSQKNMGKFMKILLVKRLESSFFAFKNSIGRFIHSYEMFIKEFEKGNVYVSKKHTNKIFELLESDDDQAIQQLIDEKKANKYDSKEFTDGFIKDLQSDYAILKQVKTLWQKVDRDPKLLTFLDALSKKQTLKQNKLIIFTESKETAEYLNKNIDEKFPGKSICFTGGSGEAVRDKVIENFDAKARHPKDDYRILVSTEVLSEGVNLHRSNVVVNYDIPWNPTRMMQRVGRINRIDTQFDRIYTFNFFPTKQSNDQIKLREAAEAKINAFLTLLGGDAALLTEGEPVESHELFNRLISNKAIIGDDEDESSELKYLRIIKDLRDKDPDTFEKIKRLPKKARSAKRYKNPPIPPLLKGGDIIVPPLEKGDEGGFKEGDSLITYFRRGKLQKFFMAGDAKNAQELDFISAAAIFESGLDDKKLKLPERFYELLDMNKEAFVFATTDGMPEAHSRAGRDSAGRILGILKATMKNTKQLTDEQELYLKRVFTQLEEGGIPKQTAKETLKALDEINKEIMNPLKVLAVLQTHIPERFLTGHYAERYPQSFGKREVVLSLYLSGE